MTDAYTAGELKTGNYVLESVFGTIPTGALAYAGDTTALYNTSDDGIQFLNLPGSRSYGAHTHGPYKKACTYKAYSRVAAEWKDFWAKYGMGATTGLLDHLSSFTFTCDLYNGTTHVYQIYSGCKINKLTISWEKVGKVIEFEADIWAQWHQTANAKAITGLQNVTIAADASTPAGAILFMASNPQINIAAGGLANLYAENAKLTIEQHLEREDGDKVGDDSVHYPTAIGIHENERDIIFECNAISKDQTYQDAMRAGSVVTALTIVIDNETVTLSNGEFEPSYAKYEQKVNREPIRIRFKTLAIA